MEMTLLAGRANPGLANLVAQRLGISVGSLKIEDFPDGELRIELEETVRGPDVYIIQPTGPLVADNIVELLLVSDACYRTGASSLTAVTPYFGYARQDRRARGREPISAKLEYAVALDLPLAIVHKERISGAAVTIHGITSSVKEQTPLIVDDMVSTGGTIEAAANALIAAGCKPEITVAATHGLMVGSAVSRLEKIPVRRFYFTNSMAIPPTGTLPSEEVDLSFLLAEAFRLMYEGSSLHELTTHL